MKYRNTKLFKAMMLSAMALVILSAHRVSASEMEVYKCISPKQKITFQDVACGAKDKTEILNLRFNQAADIAPGLRPLEMYMLTQIYQGSDSDTHQNNA